jgi:hypothetical protein
MCSEMNAGLQNCARLLVSILEPGVARAQAREAETTKRNTDLERVRQIAVGLDELR